MPFRRFAYALALVTCSSNPATKDADASADAIAQDAQTPDLLNNASFEQGEGGDGWSGFRDGANNPEPSGNVSRSTEQSKDGSYSIKFAWDNNTADLGAQVFYNIGSRTHVWARTWFYIATAYPNGQGFKFFRVQDPGFNQICGVQVLNGKFVFVTPSGDISYVGNGVPSVNAWHSVEFEVDLANTTASVWVDGVAQSSGGIWYDPNNHLSWNGTQLNYGVNGGMTAAGYLDITRIINPTTNTGAAYFDRVAISTLGPIGP